MAVLSPDLLHDLFRVHLALAVYMFDLEAHVVFCLSISLLSLESACLRVKLMHVCVGSVF